MKFQGFELDDFQIKAIESLEKGKSVVVSAATGTGKTLIADWVIDRNIAAGRSVIYTAPIKALSNQKYRDFCARYGKECIGIVTGDVQINQGAPVLIMTTEIYRNMLLSRDDMISKVSHVIFDEIHYISDWERGTIWEESLIFSPKHVRFLCLSATIPNAEQFAAWIASIKQHDVEVIKHIKRAVPLKHLLYDAEQGVVTAAEALRTRRERKPFAEEVVASLRKRDWLPCLYFVFSRAECEKQAHFLAKKQNFLNSQERSVVQQKFREIIPAEQRELESVRRVREWCAKGIAVHHAGLLPAIKEAVEVLFAEGMIKVLFTTETFAVGLNLPARATVFNSFTKYDGMNFRPLSSKEYFQLAGRAGRRGIDKEGFALIVLDKHDDVRRIQQVTAADTEPIVSQFKMSYNTALHLVSRHTPPEVETILKSSFDYFVRKQEQGHIRVMAAYNNRLKKLRQLGYLDENGPTPRGHFLSSIYSYELIIGEIYSTNLWKKIDEVQHLILAAAIAHEPRKQESHSQKGAETIVKPILSALEGNELLEKEINRKSLKSLAVLVKSWATGATFESLLKLTDAQEGDIIHLFRRIADTLRQVRHATHDEELRERLHKALELIGRDVVSVVL